MLHRLLHASRRLPSLWRRYWALPAVRRGALWQAAGWVVIVRAALEVFSFRRVLKVVESRARRRLGKDVGERAVESHLQMVKVSRRAGPQNEALGSSPKRSVEEGEALDVEASASEREEVGHSTTRSTRHPSDRSGINRSGPTASVSNRSGANRPSTQRSLKSNPAAQRVLWAVRATSRRLLPQRPCLTQALVGRFLLARHGVDAVIQIGVTKDESELKAHAWLEHDGSIILGGVESREKYQPFPALRV